jgi:hypothetical protein
MKNSTSVIFLLLIILVACRNRDNECRYESGKDPNDTSLYISYAIMGKDYKFIQVGKKVDASFFRSSLTTNGRTIWNNQYKFYFDNPDSLLHPQVILMFWDTSLVFSGNAPIRYLSRMIKDTYKFTHPRRDEFTFVDPLPADTLFMIGASLSLQNIGFSTKAVMNYCNYNYDTISNHVLKDSYLKVTGVESLCNHFTLIEGVFSTKLMKNPEQAYLPETLAISGKFRLISY